MIYKYLILMLAIVACYFSDVEQCDDSLILRNIEALSDVNENPERRVSDITEYYDSNITDVPVYDENDSIISWKQVVVSITHTVVCSNAKGTLKCRSRKDLHINSDDWNQCPYDF